MVALGFVPKLCGEWGSHINHVHSEFREQEPEDTCPLRSFLSDTRTASQSGQEGSPAFYLTQIAQAPVASELELEDTQHLHVNY